MLPSRLSVSDFHCFDYNILYYVPLCLAFFMLLFILLSFWNIQIRKLVSFVVSHKSLIFCSLLLSIFLFLILSTFCGSIFKFIDSVSFLIKSAVEALQWNFLFSHYTFVSQFACAFSTFLFYSQYSNFFSEFPFICPHFILESLLNLIDLPLIYITI